MNMQMNRDMWTHTCAHMSKRVRGVALAGWDRLFFYDLFSITSNSLCGSSRKVAGCFWVEQEKGWLMCSSPRLAGAMEKCRINLFAVSLRRTSVFFLCCETRARALVCNSCRER